MSGETNTDDLSPAPDAWSRPDIPLHALAMLKNARDGIEPLLILICTHRNGIILSFHHIYIHIYIHTSLCGMECVCSGHTNHLSLCTCVNVGIVPDVEGSVGPISVYDSLKKKVT